MARIEIDIFEHETDLEHLHITVDNTVPAVVDRLVAAAQTAQALGRALLLWYDGDEEVLRVSAVETNLREGA